MDFGSDFVYLGNEEEDYEDIRVTERDNCALSDSDCSDDDGETCMLDILDTAGQEEYSSVRDLYVREGHGFVIIYSITDANSLQEAEAIWTWIKRLRSDEESYAILVANKQDLAGSAEAVVTSQQGRELAQKLGLSFFETSAKTGQGVEEAMHGLVKIVPRSGDDYKIVMLGSGAVGKSSITVRFVSNTFVDDYDPTIEDSFRKMIQVKGLSAMTKAEKKSKKKMLKQKRRAAKGGRSSSRNSIFQQNVLAQSPQQMFQPQMQQQQILQPQMQQQQQQMQQRPLSGNLFGGMLNSARRAFGFGSPNTRPGSAHSSNGVPPPPPPPFGRRGGATGSDEEKTTTVRQKKSDGNVVLIPLRNLAEEPKLVTGDATKCKKCQAILTSTAVLEREGDNATWTCEFCGEINRNLDVTEEEIPKGESFDYMISPATKITEDVEMAEAKPEKKTTPGVLVYCMDISSSMSCLCHVPQSQALWREERTRGEETIDSVTRLRCIQKAIERLAEQLKEEQPEKKVLLVVFHSQVNVKAGGATSNLPNFTSLDRLSYDRLLEMGLELANTYPLLPLEQSHAAIDQAVKALIPTGCTALGPALALCTGYVSKVPSSEIVLCTDGEPNTGVGSLNGMGQNPDGGFYSMIGNYARSKNITINILSMEGASTGLQHVSKAAENSGGTTTKLNPVEIVRQLRLIAQNEVVATEVTVRFFLHPDFVFDEPDFPQNLSHLEKEVGSVKKETDLTFRFKLREESKHKAIPSVPFQVQIEYTRPDGMKCVRVLCKRTEATSSRQTMEQCLNVSVVGVSAMKSTVKMAMEGKANDAQHMVKNVKRLVDRGAKNSKQKEERSAFKNEVSKWDDHLTYHNARLQAGDLGDDDADIYQGAISSNMVQQSSAMGHSKMAAISKRKMNAKAKASYYSHYDDY